MVLVTDLAAYRDERGNEIAFDGPAGKQVRFKFTGSNNRAVIAAGARIGTLVVDFDCDNGTLQIGPSRGVPAFSGAIRIGQDATVTLGANVSCTTTVAISACEGTSVSVGDDVMFASENQVRADDGHPIFDVESGRRVNVSRSITIGDHVWLGRGAVVLGGSTIGSGSVLGYGSVLKGRVPNNAVAAGVPARVRRRNIAWERPHLSLSKPYYKPDASTVTKSRYWALTEELGARSTVLHTNAGAARSRARRVARSVRRRLRTIGR